VLKLIGDGILTIFKVDDPSDARLSALQAEADLRWHVRAINQRHTAEGSPVTSV